MKKVLFLIILFSAVTLSGCSVGVEKDLTTGQKSSNSGLYFDKVTSLYEGKEVSKNQEVEFGEFIEIYFSKVGGFNEENGKVFPGASLVFVSIAGEETVVAEDMFEKYSQNGVSPEDAASIKFKATIGNPLKTGENYKLKMKIWDKKGTGKIESELDVKIKASNQNTTSENSEDNSKNILADNDLPMFGGPNAYKTPEMIQADENFINEIVEKIGTREKGSVAMVEFANDYLNKGDLKTAMMRFNQAWLLNPNNKDVYSGFVKVLNLQGKTGEASRITETYLSN